MLSNIIIPLPPVYQIDYDDTDGVDCDQTAADVVAFPIPFKCEVMRALAAVTETCAGDTTTPVVKFDKRPTAGSDTGRGDGDIGNLALSTSAAGKTMYDDAGIGTLLYPGMEVVCKLAVAATGTDKAGHFRPMLLVKPVPEEPGNIDDLVETTA